MKCDLLFCVRLCADSFWARRLSLNSSSSSSSPQLDLKLRTAKQKQQFKRTQRTHTMTSSATPDTLFTSSGKRYGSCDPHRSLRRHAWNLVRCVAAVPRASPLDTPRSRESFGPCEIHPCVLAAQAGGTLRLCRLIQAEHSGSPGGTRL